MNLGRASLTLSGTGAGVVAGNTFVMIDNDGGEATAASTSIPALDPRGLAAMELLPGIAAAIALRR